MAPITPPITAPFIAEFSFSSLCAVVVIVGNKFCLNHWNGDAVDLYGVELASHNFVQSFYNPECHFIDVLLSCCFGIAERSFNSFAFSMYGSRFAWKETDGIVYLKYLFYTILPKNFLDLPG